MPFFSQKSLSKLNTCHPDLVHLMSEVIKEIDFTIICGHRGCEEQNKAFAEGKSKLQFPNSKHNSFPSRAVDIAPFPIDWEDAKRFKELAEKVKSAAHRLGIGIRWGGDFETLVDMPHYQLDD